MAPDRKDGYVPLPDAQPEEHHPTEGSRGPPHGPNQTQPAPREWKNGWYQCCGDCDGIGCAVCCLTHWCFPCVFGYLKRRAFGDAGKAFAWGFTLCLCVFYLFAGGCLLYDRTLRPGVREAGSRGGHFDLGIGAHKPRPILDASDIPPSRTTESATFSLYVCMFMVLIMVLTIMMVGGARNRLQMRKKFGIRPAKCCAPDQEHVLLWVFCGECALCQETRTVIHNNVVRGVWRGPDGLATTPEGQHPPPRQDQSRGPRWTPPTLESFTRPVDVV